MKKYCKINQTCNQDQDYLEAFEISGNNFISVKAGRFGLDNQKEEGCRVELAFSSDGMLGFGKELIREDLYMKQNNLSRNISDFEVRPYWDEKKRVSYTKGFFCIQRVR